MKSVNSLISGQISTEEEAIIAVEQHPETLTYIPEHLQTENVLFEALIRKSDLFKQVHVDQLTSALIKRLLTIKPVTQEFIPDELLSREIYIEQVRENGLWLQYVPIEHRDLEMCTLAINENVDAHEFVPNEIQNKEYLDALIIIDPEKIIDVNVESRSLKVVYKLLDKDHSMIRHLPIEYRTKKLCLKALKQSIFAIQWFPDEMYEEEEIFKIIREHDYFDHPEQYGNNFEMDNQYDALLIRPILVDALLERDVEKYFPLIPVSKLSVEHCKTAIRANPSNILICPPILRKRHNLWEKALSTDHSLLRNVRSSEKTGAIEVLDKNIKALSTKKSLFDFLVDPNPQ
jgi:hypothetical protein